MAYKMTARRARALKKAQLISAQKRKRRFGFTSPDKKKLSRGQKKAVAVVAAGAVIATGAYGTSAWMNMELRKKKVAAMKANREQARWNVNARRLTRSPDMSNYGRRYLNAKNEMIIRKAGDEDGEYASVASREVRATRGVKVYTRTKGLAAQIMMELNGTQIPGRPKGAKYKVIFGERTNAQ